MSAKAHAILSPSGASRWLACTPSARLEQKFPDSAGEAAREGTLAHALGELILQKETKLITATKFKKDLDKIEKHELYNNAMYAHAEDYAYFVLERLAGAKAHTNDALLEIEVKLNLTHYVPEGFGTGDAVIIADGTLDLIDMKYGKGVLVEAENNKQMMLYALGALRLYDYIYDIQRVCMTIYQPRLNNFSSWEIAIKDLLDWANKELVPKATLAFKGEGIYHPGEHCRFCRAKAICKANAEYQLELAKYDFMEADLLNDEAVADILERAKLFESWLKAVKDYALIQARDENKRWPGFKLVEGRSNRVITEPDSVAKRLEELDYSEEQIWNKKIKGITDLQKLLGKKAFTEELGKWIIKPAGSPTLVPETDKRPELNSEVSAADDFADTEI